MDIAIIIVIIIIGFMLRDVLKKNIEIHDRINELDGNFDEIRNDLAEIKDHFGIGDDENPI